MSLLFDMPSVAVEDAPTPSHHLVPLRARLRDLARAVPIPTAHQPALLDQLLGDGPISRRLDGTVREAIRAWAGLLPAATNEAAWRTELNATWEAYLQEQVVLELEARNQNRMGSKRVESRVKDAWRGAYQQVYRRSRAEVLDELAAGDLPRVEAHAPAIRAFEDALQALATMQRPDPELRGLHQRMDSPTTSGIPERISAAFADLRRSPSDTQEIDHIISLSVLSYLLESARDKSLDGNPGKAELRLAGWLCSAVDFLLQLLARIDEHRSRLRADASATAELGLPDSTTVFRAVLADL